MLGGGFAGKLLYRKQRRGQLANIICYLTLIALLLTMVGSSCKALVSTTTRCLLHNSRSRSLYRLQSQRTIQEFTTLSTDKSVRANVSMKEIELSLADGMVLRGQHWTNTNGGANVNATKILALHGWLDNCRSFHLMAPKLLEKLQNPIELVAMDLPGHGRSSHKPLGGPPIVLTEGTYYIAEMLDKLGWVDDSNDENNNKISLIGHSMGGSLATTYAGVFPEHVSNVVSIDIYGPEPAFVKKTASQIRSHITQRRAIPRGKPLYPSLERAAERRQKAATMSRGGNQYISLEAATELVTRAMEPVYDGNDDKKGYEFKHDARLMWPSIQYLTQEQILAILGQVKCPVCLLAAEDGYPFDADRIERVVSTLNNPVHKLLPGSHHLHADPDTADAVVDVICEFFGGHGKTKER